MPNWTRLKVKSPIANSPKDLNNNFTSFERYIDIFYDGSTGVLQVPLETAGRVKGARGEFVTTVTDNLVVRNQFTNLYDNITTADAAFTNAYNGDDVSTRIATSESSTNYIWPYEPSTHTWFDVNIPYIKISNDVSYGFSTDILGQEFRVLLNTDTSTSSPYTILLESSTGGSKNLQVANVDAEKTWLKIIAVGYDASMGPKWTVKEYGGDYTIL